MKSEIIEQLGQADILLPQLIAWGLLANDRVKARLGVLQAAGRHARDQRARFDLMDECRAAGIDSIAAETLVNSAGMLSGMRVTAPGLGDLGMAVWDDVTAMIRAIKAADVAEGDVALARLAAIKDATPLGVSDVVELSQIARATELSDSDTDSLHRLVMDLHKALNRLSTVHADEILAGAHVYGLLPGDRSTVEAFMHGVESTRKLKFDHPGLATTAARSGSRLTIQNDIGETDAHVVVIGVEADAVTITYTDVHRPRAKFFTGLLRDFAVKWSGLDRKRAEGLGDEGIFYLVSGRYSIIDSDGRNAFLEAVGASLVFLIDWNKARKVLRAWISKADAIRVLDWGARNRFGHRAFLELGGAELVGSAVHHATPTRIGFGERLDRALGRDAAIDFLKTVLRVSAEALLQGSSVRLARDRIEADLVRHLQRVEGALLAIVVRQSGLAREIASDIARFIADQQAGRSPDGASLANRAQRIEKKADRIALEARNEIARFNADRSIERLINCIEEAIDELEQAAFIGSLVPSGITSDVLKPLGDLCAAAVTGAEAAATGTVAAAEIPEGHRVDSEDALAAISRLIEAEHAADAAERAITMIVLRGDLSLKAALSVLELARALERAADQLAGFGHLLRIYVLADLSNLPEG